MAGEMDDTSALPNPCNDPYGYIGFTLNPDGSVTRSPFPLFPTTSPSPDPSSTPLPRSLSKDIPVNSHNRTWARVFLPREALQTKKKLPLIVYYHGGGFVVLHADSGNNHDFCANMAAEVSAVVVSVEYRLAPEHRLPAAYDDAVEALHVISATEDEWLTSFADFTNCFLMGTSAGGNIAYHAGLRAAGDVEALAPLIVRRMILHHPFFGGVHRTASEERLVNDAVLPPVASDVMWKLSLPLGADRDHWFANPKTTCGGSPEVEKVAGLGWKVLVTGCRGDPLVDRQMEVVELMKGKGLDVVDWFVEGGYHGFDFAELSKAKDLYLAIKEFVASA